MSDKEQELWDQIIMSLIHQGAAPRVAVANADAVIEGRRKAMSK
jgi:hypothetical protein